MGANPIKKGAAYLKSGSEEIRTQYNRSASRSLHLAGISGAANLILGLGKILSGVLSRSVFACVNGCYTLGMVGARCCALAGVLRGGDQASQYRFYRWSGRILIIASLLYMAYSGWSFRHPKQVVYHEYIALAIATFIFAEIGLNLRGVLVHRKNHTPLLHAIKTINLAASLISLVLTQSAILAFAAEEDHDPAVNGLLGLVMGACAALLGVYMLRRIGKLERSDQDNNCDNRRTKQ